LIVLVARDLGYGLPSPHEIAPSSKPALTMKAKAALGHRWTAGWEAEPVAVIS
jgi:hypothetical protein